MAKNANYKKLEGGPAQLLATVISRSNQVVLTEYSTNRNVNFLEIIHKVLKARRLPQGENMRKTYKYEDRFFLHYLNDNLLSIIVIADVEFSARIAYAYLQDIHQKFIQHYEREVILVANEKQMHGQFSKIIEERMHFFNTDSSVDKVLQIQKQVENVQEIMHENLSKILERGEKIELLLSKSEDLETTAITFKKSSRTLKRKMWCRNFKLNILLAVIVFIVVAFFILVIACDGFSFKRCS